jgi:hypothetical protein
VITASSISKAYGKFTALNDVSFVAQPGEVTGFLGPKWCREADDIAWSGATGWHWQPSDAEEGCP